MSEPKLEPELKSASPLQDIYLDDFQRLGDRIYLYTPTSGAKNGSSLSKINNDTIPSPDLIIFCSWMGASPRNIKKYIKTYQTRYATSSILLLRQDGGDMSYRPVSQQVKNIQPAVSVVRKFVAERGQDRIRVLLHIFSNGGSYSAIRLADTYQASSPSGNELLPISALILDSTPSLPDFKTAHAAISESLPRSGFLRFLGQGVIWAFLGTTYAMDHIFGTENVTLWVRRNLNEPQGAFMQGRVKRVYIYSNSDALIPAAEVETHAADAAEKIGEDRVQSENFGASKHVGHVILDAERYWRIVEGLWKETAVKLAQ
jgi:hypothetical protein